VVVLPNASVPLPSSQEEAEAPDVVYVMPAAEPDVQTMEMPAMEPTDMSLHFLPHH